MRRFLEYAVRQAMDGKGGELKEALVGIEVFDRPADYDPRVDPIVRVEARRLRQKIEEYYQAEGERDPLRIEFVKGSYAPAFRRPEFAAARGPESAPAAAARTVLVLPFASLGPGTEQDYFSDGLTQELIHALTRVPNLRVVAWRSSARLRGKSAQESEVGEQTRAGTIVEGSVRRQGDRVRIHVQIVDAASGFYLWTETFERTLSDLFALQEQIAHSIAAALRIQMAAPAGPRPAYRIEAHDFYLQGRHEWNQRSPESLRRSTVLFERAIAEDPRCAPAWAGLADSYALLAEYGIEAPSPCIAQARRAALRALELDPDNAEALSSLGLIAGLFDWEWDRSEEHYRRAIAINPGYATAHHWYGLDLLALVGRFEEAEIEITLARQLDPLEPIIVESEGYLALLRGDFAAAARVYGSLAASAPQYAKGHTGLGRALWGLGDFNGAIRSLETGRQLSGDMPSILGALAQVHGCAGNHDAARRFLGQLRETAAAKYVSASCLALGHLGLGETGEALDWLERGVERHDMPMAQLYVHPGYRDLRGHPRFEALLQRMNFAGFR